MKRLITLAIASSCAFSIMTSCASGTEAGNSLSASVSENNTASIISEAPEVVEEVVTKIEKQTENVAEEIVTKVEEKAEVAVDKVITKVEDVSEKIEEVAPVEVEKVESANGAPQISFKETKVDFGIIQQGESFEYDFKFTNTGDAPLLITAARGSCGCTVPEWPKEQIAPGAVGNIHVKFNSRGKRGNQHKTVTLTTNAEPVNVVLHLNGIVNVPEQK